MVKMRKKKSSGSGNSLFDQVKGKKGEKKGTGENSGISQTEFNIFGPSYSYVDHIKTPGELGMRSEGSFDAVADDVGGLLAYMDTLVSGHGRLGVGTKTKNKNGSISDYAKPLGNKFFLETAVKCKDKGGKKHTRYIYVNNVPDGSIPLVSNISSSISFPEFGGLLPGVLSNLAQIHPMQIISAFTAGDSPTCQAVTMEVVDAETHKSTMATRYLTNEDIAIMPAAWFPSDKPQSSYDLEEMSKPDEEFCTINGCTTHGSTTQLQTNGERKDFSQMPNDIVIKFYYSVLGLLGIYILLRMMIKKK
jgi:hypothetical protein